jgi:hypothetical protein
MRALLTGITPYELVMGDSLVLRDIPEWGSITWVHDTSSGKLGVHANEGHWVRYDLNSNGHRVYWKDRRTVTVERNVVFSKGDLPRIEDLIVEGITDEPEGENNGEREVSLDRDEEGTAPIPVNEPERAKHPHPKTVLCQMFDGQHAISCRADTSGTYNPGSSRQDPRRKSSLSVSRCQNWTRR